MGPPTPTRKTRNCVLLIRRSDHSPTPLSSYGREDLFLKDRSSCSRSHPQPFDHFTISSAAHQPFHDNLPQRYCRMTTLSHSTFHSHTTLSPNNFLCNYRRLSSSEGSRPSFHYSHMCTIMFSANHRGRIHLFITSYLYCSHDLHASFLFSVYRFVRLPRFIDRRRRYRHAIYIMTCPF